MSIDEQPNLSCKSVQHRLATQWGYVKSNEWAGLTDEEKRQILLDDPIDWINAIEAKLKEKNT